MKAPLFEYPTYQYQIKDWEFKKIGFLIGLSICFKGLEVSSNELFLP